jgi:hypothetical protein
LVEVREVKEIIARRMIAHSPLMHIAAQAAAEEIIDLFNKERQEIFREAARQWNLNLVAKGDGGHR